MPAITKGAFLAPATPEVHQVPMPECGPDAYVGVLPLSAKDLVALRNLHGATGNSGDNIGFVFDVLARVLCDEAGRPLFDDAADVAANFGLPVKTLERLAAEALRIGGLSVAEKN